MNLTEEGLAQQMVYGSGEGQNTKHYYAGTLKKAKRKRKTKNKQKKTCNK